MNKKRLLAWLTALLLLASIPAMGEEEAFDDEEVVNMMSAAEIALEARPDRTQPTHLTVGNTTRVSGNFFTSGFGNNTSDIDVRSMLHGYNLVVWANQVQFKADPQVVKSIHKSLMEGDTVYTITLQEDLTWNNGEPITAKDYVFSLLLQASPVFADLGAATGEWKPIVGFEEYHTGMRDCFEGVRLIDDATLSVTVKSEYEPFFYELSYLSVEPYPISVLAPGCCVVDTQNGAAIRDADDTEKNTIFRTALLQKTIMAKDGYLHQPKLTCGPYQLTAYDAEKGEVDFAINPCYKGNNEGVKPWIDTVKLVSVPQSDMVAMLQRGEVDLLNKVVSGERIVEARAMLLDGFDFKNYARIGYGFLAFSCEKGAMRSQAVRQAIAYSFDSDTFCTDFLSGFGVTVKGYYGLGQWTSGVLRGTIRPDDMDEEDEAKWNELNIDSLNDYKLDLKKAENLLIKDGWTLNEQGEPFRKGTDKVRCKQMGDELVTLRLDYAQCEGNEAAEMVRRMLTNNLPKIGAELTVHKVSFSELLADHYRQNEDRLYDLSFMATNFVSVFDPYMTLAGSDEYEGEMNTSGLVDDKLVELAWDLHATAPMNLLGYMQKWVKFQARYNELLPTMPIYSNVYFDFHTDRLKNYYVNSAASWPDAVLYAYMQESDAEAADDEPLGEDEFIAE